MSSHLATSLLVVLLALVGSGWALHCFVCNTATDSSCADPFHDDSQVLLDNFGKECQNKTDEETGDVLLPFCRKVVEHIDRVYMNTSGTVRVHRECAYEYRDISDCYQKRAEDYVLEVCQCKDRDLCNAAPAPFTPASSLAAVLALVVPFLARFV